MSQCSKKKNWEMGPWGVRCQDSLNHGSKDNRISWRSTEIHGDQRGSPYLTLSRLWTQAFCMPQLQGLGQSRHAKPWKALSAFVCMFKNVLQHRGWCSRACNVEKLTRSIAMPWYTAPKPKGEASPAACVEHALNTPSRKKLEQVRLHMTLTAKHVAPNSHIVEILRFSGFRGCHVCDLVH